MPSSHLVVGWPAAARVPGRPFLPASLRACNHCPSRCNRKRLPQGRGKCARSKWASQFRTLCDQNADHLPTREASLAAWELRRRMYSTASSSARLWVRKAAATSFVWSRSTAVRWLRLRGHREHLNAKGGRQTRWSKRSFSSTGAL